MFYRRIKEAQSTPSFLEPKKWSEMISIKLKKIGESNQAAVDVMDGQENLPFYEPIVASQLPETPDVLIKLYNKEQSTSEVLVFFMLSEIFGEEISNFS